MSSAALFSQEKDKKDEKDEKPKWDVSNPYPAGWKINEVLLTAKNARKNTQRTQRNR